MPRRESRDDGSREDDSTGDLECEVDTVADPPGPDNPHKNAFRTRSTVLTRESLAQRLVEPRAARFWRIVNPSSRNRLGGPVGYRLMPGENVPPFAAPEASVYSMASQSRWG